MKKFIAILMVFAVVVFAGCVNTNPGKKINNANIKNKYERSNGFESVIKMVVEKPVKSSMFELVADFNKNEKMKYTVISPSFMKGLKLDSDDTSAIIDYIGQTFKVPKDMANIPVSMFFKLPDILQHASSLSSNGLSKDPNGLVYVEFVQKDINFKVYFNSESEIPTKIIFSDKLNLFNGTLVFEKFLYK